MRTKTLTAAALSALALTGAAAETAAADSILYLKGGDVWLSTPDGARQFQVTTTGGYRSASQSDDGTIVALKGQRLHKLDRLGKVLADNSTAVEDGTNDAPMPYASTFIGPHEVDLSPNGRKVAYNFHWQYWTTFGGSSTGYHMLRQGVGVTAPDANSAWSDAGMGYQTGWLDSAWYDDDTLVYGKKASHGMMDIAFNDVGRQNTGSTNWFHHTSLPDMRQPAVSPDRGLIAVVGDSNNEWSTGQQLWVWESTGPAPALPNLCNAYGNPTGGTYASPVFSPDGKALAWEEGDGVHVVTGQDQCSNPAGAKLLIPGGSEPDWARADVPAGRPAPPVEGPKTGDAGVKQDTSSGSVVREGSGSPKSGGKVEAPETRSKGTPPAPAKVLTLSLRCRGACSVRGKVRAPKALAKRLGIGTGVLASGSARRAGKGRLKLDLALTPAGRAALAKVGSRKVTLSLTIRDRGTTRTVTRKVALA